MLQNKKTTLIIMIAVGLALCGLGIYLYYFQTKGFVPTTAEIVQIDETFAGVDSDGHDEYDHDVYVTYSVNGRTYSGVKLDTYSSNYAVGKRIPIYYNPENPEKIHGDSKFIAKIFIFVGPAVSAIAAAALVTGLKKKKDESADSLYK